MNTTTAVLMENSQVRDVVDRSHRYLKQMLDPAEQIFCYTYREARSGPRREGVSPRYTLMTLLGLQRAFNAGYEPWLDLIGCFNRIRRNTNWITNVGDAGLVLWTAAKLVPSAVPVICAELNIENALERFSKSAIPTTMELAWFLTGLVYVQQTSINVPAYVQRLAETTARTLLQNAGSYGIFGHLSSDNSLRGWLRGHIGSFADQVYPTYALAKFGEVFNDATAVAASAACARRICALQGPLGQWWWHYNSRTGNAIEHYPVYSVHQHAMGPMALIAAGDAAGTSFDDAILRGLNWITHNELGTDMRDDHSGVIWRSVYLDNVPRQLRRLAAIFSTPQWAQPKQSILNIKRECRPYELGWCLYAFCGRAASVI